ncbi:MAG TPA: hypothetical protein PK908_05105, partial [Bacteroidales bacterium]|nr:hypothetical protein [Bacteroidales bacterium]
ISKPLSKKTFKSIFFHKWIAEKSNVMVGNLILMNLTCGSYNIDKQIYTNYRPRLLFYNS